MTQTDAQQHEQQRLDALKALGILYLPLEERFDRITRTLCRLFDVPVAYLSLMDRDTQWFKSIQGLDMVSTPRRDSLCQHTLAEEELLICHDLQQDARFADNPYVSGAPFARFYAAFALKNRGYNVGTLCLIDTRPRTFSAADTEALRDIGSWAQTELHLNRLTDAQIELQDELDNAYRLARIDSLTRLWNQGTIRHILHNAFQNHLLNLTPLSVLMLDADYFKQVNDRYGHATGDEVLRSLATALRHCVRPEDAIGRYGGEEFLVVLHDCDTQRAEKIARRILSHIRSLRFPAAPGLEVTASIGIAGADRQNLQDENVLMDMADKALYQAKSQGRDQICVAPLLPPR